MLKAVLVQGLLVANVVLANEVKLVLFRLLHREHQRYLSAAIFCFFSQTKCKSMRGQTPVKC